MDFSTLAPRTHETAQAKFYLSLVSIKLLNAASLRIGLPMSRIVDNLVREELSRQLPSDVVEKITGEHPPKTRKKRIIRPRKIEEFDLG